MTPRKPLTVETVALALGAIGRALRTGVAPIAALDEQARSEHLIPGSQPYDDAAELMGFPYCRALDLYVDRATRDRVDRLHFSQAHLALA